MIAFFGMGMLGSGFVRALRRRGEGVRVWNRTPDKARALEADGATAFDDPAEAARSASHIHLTLSDDAAVDDVLERARPGLAPGVTIVDHTTTSAGGAGARVARWADRGMTFVHAPVFMGPQNALESTGVMLVSGDRAAVDPLREPLGKMTGKLVDLGPDPQRAATFKLFGNCFLMFLTTGVGEIFALAKAHGIPAAEAATLFSFFNPGASIEARVRRVLDTNAPPSWELAMARKDARLMTEAATVAGVPLEVLPAIIALMDTFIADGHAKDDWTVIATKQVR